MFNFENITGFINYTRTIDAVKSRAIITGVNQSSVPFNSDFAEETLSGVMVVLKKL